MKKMAQKGKNSVKASAAIVDFSPTRNHGVKLKKALHPTVINRGTLKRRREAFNSLHRISQSSLSESESRSKQ